MAIDAVIDSIKRYDNKTVLLLRPRIDGDGHASIAGRRKLLITRNPDYEPQTGDEIWGNAHEVVISKNGIDFKFNRIVRHHDGRETVLGGSVVMDFRTKLPPSNEVRDLKRLIVDLSQRVESLEADRDAAEVWENQ